MTRRVIQTCLRTLRLLAEVDRRSTLIAALGIVGSAFTFPVIILVLRDLLTDIAANRPLSDFVFPLVIIGGALLVQQALQIIANMTLVLLRQRALVQLNDRVLRKLQEIPFEWFEDEGFQSEYGLIVREGSARPVLLVQSLSMTATTALSLAAVTITVLLISPLFLIAVALILAPAVALEARFQKRSLELETSASPALLRMYNILRLSIDAVWQRDIRVYASSVLPDAYADLGKGYLKQLRGVLTRYELLRLVGATVSIAAVVGAVSAALVELKLSRISIVEVGVLIPGLYLVLSMASTLAAGFGVTLDSLNYATKLFEFMDRTFEGRRPPMSRHDHGRIAAIELKGVEYRYPRSSRAALADFTLTLRPGVTPMAGPNGAGKSTLVKLLAGLIEPTSGTITTIGLTEGQPTDVPRSVLFQDPSHFYLTIRQAVTMRHDNVAGETDRVIEALTTAGLLDHVNTLPDGIDTYIGSGFGAAADLSGGQWQRLALARLLFHDGSVLVLDEPIASLDADGERKMFAAIATLARDRVVVFTTHRLATIPPGAKILVIVDGQLKESGTHDELLKGAGHYRQLYAAQAGGQ